MEDILKRYHELIADSAYFKGWMIGCLKELNTMLDEGRVTGNEYTLSRLRKIANAIQDAEQNCKLDKERIAEISAKL